MSHGSAGVVGAHYAIASVGITYEGAGTAAVNTVQATTLNVPYPTGIQADDVLVLMVNSNTSTAPTNPGTFTSQLTGTSGGSSPSFRISTKVATGSESGNLAVTTPNTLSQGRMFLFRGVNTTTPIDVAGTSFGSSTGTTAYNIPTLSTTTTGVALVYMGTANSATGTFSPPTVPATFNEVHDVATQPATTMGYLIWSGSGATGTINLTRSTSIRGNAGVIALRPA